MTKMFLLTSLILLLVCLFAAAVTDTASAKTKPIPPLRLFINGVEVLPDANNEIHINTGQEPAERDYKLAGTTTPGHIALMLARSPEKRDHDGRREPRP